MCVNIYLDICYHAGHSRLFGRIKNTYRPHRANVNNNLAVCQVAIDCDGLSLSSLYLP